MLTDIKTILLDTSKYQNDQLITIKCKINKGMNYFNISSTSRKYSEEARDRINSAFNFFNLKFPYGNIKIQSSINEFNDKTKIYDMAIALSILENQGYIDKTYDGVFLGEINFNGEFLELENPYRIVKFALENKIKRLYIPYGNYGINFYHKDIEIIYIKDLRDLIHKLKNNKGQEGVDIKEEDRNPFRNSQIDINDVIDQAVLVRALLIAIAGKHHILIKGAIGSGKTMTLQAIKKLMPSLDYKGKLIASNLYSSYFNDQIPILYHSLVEAKSDLTLSKLVGNKNKYGLVSLMNYSSLLLDEMNQYPKNILTTIKLLMDNNSKGLTYINSPVAFNIIGLMNPCPCGNLGTNTKCACSPGEISRHNNKIDQSMLDRFQLKLSVSLPKYLSSKKEKYDIGQINETINNCIDKQAERYGSNEKYNGNINSKDINEYIHLNEEIKEYLESKLRTNEFSRRAIDNIIKVARTIADIDNVENIEIQHVYEAMTYQKFW